MEIYSSMNKQSFSTNKSIILVVVIGIVAIVGLSFVLSSPKTPPIPSKKQAQQTVDYNASFAIFTNGTFRVFTASMYHNLSEEVYIQADNPNIVHIKKKGITWNQFFKTLPFTLTKDCLTTGTKETFCTGVSGKLQFYLNGNRDDNALDLEINAGDQLLVTFGKEGVQQIQKQIKQLPKI